MRPTSVSGDERIDHQGILRSRHSGQRRAGAACRTATSQISKSFITRAARRSSRSMRSGTSACCGSSDTLRTAGCGSCLRARSTIANHRSRPRSASSKRKPACAQALGKSRRLRQLTRAFSQKSFICFSPPICGPSRRRPEEHEVFEVHWKPFEEAVAMATPGELRDGKSLVGLFRAAPHVASLR